MDTGQGQVTVPERSWPCCLAPPFPPAGGHMHLPLPPTVLVPLPAPVAEQSQSQSSQQWLCWLLAVEPSTSVSDLTGTGPTHK